MPYAAAMALPIRRRVRDAGELIGDQAPPRTRWSRRVTVAAVGVALFGSGALGACSSGSAPTDPALAQGFEVYSRSCVACHGVGGGGGSGPRLIGVGDRMTEEAQIAIITNGVAGTAMMAWGGRLSAEEIDAVAAYTRSLTPS